MRPTQSTLAACFAVLTMAAPALAQGSGFDQPAPPPPNSTYQGPQGFSFKGDQVPPSYDRKYVGSNDPRYSQTYQQQQEAAQKPGGGCLKYGAAGALGGHFAGHGVMGALAGCAVGSYVRHRDKEAIRNGQ